MLMVKMRVKMDTCRLAEQVLLLPRGMTMQRPGKAYYGTLGKKGPQEKDGRQKNDVERMGMVRDLVGGDGGFYHIINDDDDVEHVPDVGTLVKGSSRLDTLNQVLRSEIVSLSTENGPCMPPWDGGPSPKRSMIRKSMLSTRQYSACPDVVRRRKGRHPKCILTGSDTWRCRRFRDKKLNMYVPWLFEDLIRAHIKGAIPCQTPSLTEFDLHHGHIVYNERLAKVAILFHASEYPSWDGFLIKKYANSWREENGASGGRKEMDDVVETHLGFCQCGSTLPYDPASMNWRNILWIDNVFVFLDCSPTSLPYESLVYPGLHPFRTIMEHEFGVPIFDVFYIPQHMMPQRLARHRVFISD